MNGRFIVKIVMQPSKKTRRFSVVVDIHLGEISLLGNGARDGQEYSTELFVSLEVSRLYLTTNIVINIA